MAFLDRSISRRFDWADVHCMSDLLDWIDRVCATRLAAKWRGLCANEAQWNALLDERGGLVALAAAEAAETGLKPTEKPEMGDVGIVEFDGKPMGAIVMPSGKWRMRTLTGFEVRRDVKVLAAWSLQCRR